MADTTITVDLQGENEYEVQAYLDAGNDVVFKDADGNEVDMTAVNLDTTGDVKCRSKRQADTAATTKYLQSGGWHHFQFSKIFATGTGSGLSIVARRDG